MFTHLPLNKIHTLTDQSPLVSLNPEESRIINSLPKLQREQQVHHEDGQAQHPCRWLMKSTWGHVGGALALWYNP